MRFYRAFDGRGMNMRRSISAAISPVSAEPRATLDAPIRLAAGIGASPAAGSDAAGSDASAGQGPAA